MSASNFRNELKKALLELAWRQWTQFGVAGSSQASERYILDPEALLIFTAYIGRHDQRLFDEVMDWLCVNHRFINVMRLRALSKRTEFEHRSVLGMMAAWLTEEDASTKWRKLALDWLPQTAPVAQALFLLSNGNPMPVAGEADPVALRYGFKRNRWKRTGNSNAFPSKGIATLLLQLRGLFGVNARSEAMIGLLTQDICTIQDIAALSGYTWRSVLDVLLEMAHSNRVSRSKVERGYYYFLSHPRQEQELLLPGYSGSWRFPNWLDFYRGCIIIQESVSSPQIDTLSQLTLRSVFQEIFDEKIQGIFLDAGVTSEHDSNHANIALKFLRPKTVEALPRLIAGI